MYSSYFKRASNLTITFVLLDFKILVITETIDLPGCVAVNALN